MTQSWYFKPLRAVAVGVVIGLAFNWVLLLLPPRIGTVLLFLGVLGMLGWTFWALRDLRREMDRARQAVVDYEKIYGRYES